MVQRKIILRVQTNCNWFWKLLLVCAWVISSSLSPSRADAQSSSWMEDFALSKDRESKLAELIPGSDDYFFYHCLHYQNTNQLDQSEVMLTQWLAEHSGRETASIRAMVDRQRLLTGSYAVWQWYDRNNLAGPGNMDFKKLSRVNYAFFQVTTTF